METKTCAECLRLLPILSFYKKAKDSERTDTRCKHCRAARMRRYRVENPEIVKAIERKTREKNRDKAKARAAKWYYENTEKAKEYRKRYRKEKGHLIKDIKLKASFGIGIIEYNQMLLLQDGRCAICGTHESNLLRKLAVDHCHKTGKIRGLLCGSCNTGIGSFKDSEKFLGTAIEYLKKHKI